MMIMRFLATQSYWLGARLGHLVAKFKLGYITHNNWQKPGVWEKW